MRTIALKVAFLAQRGLPDHLILHILELAGPRSVRSVCATDKKSLELVHRLQWDFPQSWHRVYEVWDWSRCHPRGVWSWCQWRV